MQTLWVDLSGRNERDEVLLRTGGRRTLMKETRLYPGERVFVEDSDFRVPGVVVLKKGGMFVKLEWEAVVYKPRGARSSSRVANVI